MERSRDEEAEEIIRRLKAPPKPKHRMLTATWDFVTTADLQVTHGIDLEKEITEALSAMIAAEIDQELLGKIRSTK